MSQSEARDDAKAFEAALASEPSAEHYHLRLFVSGSTPRSARAIQHVRALCEERLHGRYDLEVIDVYQHPEQIQPEQIVVTPMLVKKLPLPFRKIIGDLTDRERVLAGLDIIPRGDPSETRESLLERVEDVQQRLDEAEESLRALRSGEADAVVASGPGGHHVYTLKGTDETYRVMVQSLAEGALTVTPEGLILFANERFASLLGKPLDRVMGSSLHDVIAAEDAPLLTSLLAGGAGSRAQVRLKREPAVLAPALLSASKLCLETTECLCLIVTDLSDMRRAEEELANSRRMLQLVMDTIPLGVFWKDRDGRYLGCNRRFLTESGLSTEEVVGRRDSEMPWKEQATLFVGDDRQVMETGEATSGHEGPVVGADGSRRWMRSSKVPLPGPSGGVIGVLGTHEDITESKQAEEALRASEERFRRVVENAPDAIFVQTQGCFRYLNPPAVRLFGAASDSELLNQPVLRTVHPDARAAVAEGIRLAEELGVTSHTWTEKVLRLDGTVLDVEGSAVPFTYEGQKGALVFARDISDRKRAEEELRAKEDLLSESQRIAQLGSWEFTVQPGASGMTWTPETYRLFDVSPDTFVPSFETLLSLIHPDDRAAMDGWMKACLAGSEPPDLEFRVNLRDGGVRYINGRGRVALRDAEHETIRMVGIAQDVTERKRAEEKLRRYSGALVKTNKELKRFTQIVLHDLRAPFMNLRGFSNELRGSIDTLRQSEAWLGNVPEQERAAVVHALRETIPEALGFIESSVTRMDQLTTALLRLSRAGEQEFHAEELDAGALVHEILRSLEHQIRDGNVAVKTGPLPRITTDRDAIQQVFGNLLDNAIKYLDRGRPGQIEVSAQETVDATVFQVRDNGRGIAGDDMDKVFVPFRRLGAQDVPGDGIGLALVRALLHRLGGRIECHSQLGVGTTFSFTLPRVR